MSIRQKIIKYGNMTSMLLIVLLALSLYLFRDRPFGMPLYISCWVLYIVTILGGNRLISRLKKKLFVTKSMSGLHTFTVTDDIKEMVIDILWQLGKLTIKRKRFSYTVILTRPDNTVKTERFVITNGSGGTTYLFTQDSWTLEQKNPMPGKYSILIESLDDKELSNLKELSIGGWN